MYKRVLLAFAAFTGNLFTQAALAQCSDPWINDAFAKWGQRPNGSGNTGECATARFGGATWGNYGGNAQPVLNTWVRNSRVCSDPWIGEAYASEIGRTVNGSGTSGECNAGLYGSWGSFGALATNIKAYLARNAYKPVTPPVAPPPPPPSPQPTTLRIGSIHLVSGLGAKCLGVEGGNMSPKTRLILWNCLNQADQLFKFMPNGQIQAFSGNGNLCVDDNTGMGRDGDQIQTFPCSQSGSKWRMVGHQLVSQNNKCIDLRGGAHPMYVGNQDAILYTCNGQAQQQFYPGVSTMGSGGMSPGTMSPIQPGPFTLMISQDGSGVIAQGAGNVIAQGAGNVIAQGAGNVIAAGAGNVIAQGAGN
jgi:hypothetical protein